MTRREIYLWALVLAVVGIIWSTVALTPRFVGSADDSLLILLYAAAMFLTLVFVLTQGWQVRPLGLELSVGLGIAAILMLLFVRLSIPQRTHLIEYGVLAVLIFGAAH